MKYAPPVSIRSFEPMLDTATAVIAVIALARSTIASAWTSPAFPTTQLKRRYMMTPMIVRKLGVNTPPKVPSVRRRPKDSPPVESSALNSAEIVASGRDSSRDSLEGRRRAKMRATSDLYVGMGR